MLRRTSRYLPCCNLFILTLLLHVPTAYAADPDEARGNWERLKVYFSGEQRTLYRLRASGDEEDTDIYAYWNLRGRDLLDDWLDVYLSGRFSRDLNGTENSLADDPFLGIEDRSNNWDDQLYQLYGEFHQPDGDFALKLGRQYVESADWLHIDGGQLRLFEKAPVSVQGFFGRPVSYYSGSSGDWTGGASVEGRPARGSRVRLGYVRYEDDSLEENDDLYTLDLWQRLSDEVRAHGRLSLLDNRFQTAALDLLYLNREGTNDVVLGIRHWGGNEGQSREYSPLYSVLGDLEPYTFVSGRWTTLVNSWLSVSPGASFRLVEGDHRDARNRQYGNYDLTLILEPDPRWAVSVSSQYWDVSGGDEFWGLTGEVEYRPSKIWRASVGTAYLDYEYQRDSDFGYSFENGDVRGNYDGTTNYVTRISPDAYTLYARTRVELTRWISLKAEGELEDNSEEDHLFYGLRTSLIVRF